MTFPFVIIIGKNSRTLILENVSGKWLNRKHVIIINYYLLCEYTQQAKHLTTSQSVCYFILFYFPSNKANEGKPKEICHEFHLCYVFSFYFPQNKYSFIIYVKRLENI